MENNQPIKPWQEVVFVLLLSASLVLAAIVNTGCAAHRSSLEHTTEVHDTVRAVVVQRDTVVVYKLKKDSTYLRDSIHIRESHDTVYYTVTHYEYALKLQVDTVYRNKLQHDTLVQIREVRDTTRAVEQIVTNEVPKFYRNCTIGFWILLATCAMALAGWLLWKFYGVKLKSLL